MKGKEKIRRAASLLAAVLLSIALMPAGILAWDLPDNTQSAGAVQSAAAEAADVIETGYAAEAAAVTEAGSADAADFSAEAKASAEPAVVSDPAGGSGSVFGNQDQNESSGEHDQSGSTDDQDQSGSSDDDQSASGDNDQPASGDPENHVHSMEYVSEVSATCRHAGTKAYYFCTVCEKKFLDQAGETEVTDDDLVIPILEHAWDKGVVTKKATRMQKGIKTYSCTNEGCDATKTEELSYAADPGATAKSFTLDGYKLQFAGAVTKNPPAFMNKSKVSHVWIKAAKTSITVYWDNPKNLTDTDGVIIMRKTGSAKVYKEIKRVKFAQGSAAAKSYVDKTAKKKNTPYQYIVIAYANYNGKVCIAHCSEWAAGQTSNSKLKNAYTATINKKTAKLQYKGSVKLTLKHSKPKTIYNSKSFRWYSDNTKVAKVGKTSGKVTAVGLGTTTIRGRLPSGKDITCKVTVIGAFKPAAPKLGVDIADTSSITLIWSASKYATSYDLYRSDDGINWKSPVRVTGTSKKITGLTKGRQYTFYLIARNDNNGYHAKSKASNVIYQKAEIKRRMTKVTGFPTSAKLTSGTTYKVKIKVTAPEGRTATLQLKDGKKWIIEKKITLPKGTKEATKEIVFPNAWWGKKTEWRLLIPQTNTAQAYTSPTLTIDSKRKYQNPSQYVQISDSISKHGYSHYVSPVLVNSSSTKSDHINALVKTANKYLGDAYKESSSGAPGKGVDASGLIIQSCYGAGVDLWPISPSTRPYNCVPKIMSSKLKSVKYSEPPADSNIYSGLNKGDLIFFKLENGVTGHVAIYLGKGSIIHASPVNKVVEKSTIRNLTDPDGSYKYSVAGVRRIFN